MQNLTVRVFRKEIVFFLQTIKESEQPLIAHAEVYSRIRGQNCITSLPLLMLYLRGSYMSAHVLLN